MTLHTLDARLLAAHESNDATQLVTLYCEAAEATQDATAQRFYLTHAYVFALETGAPEAKALKSQLVALGSEPDEDV